jgi:hypothetical protein
VRISHALYVGWRTQIGTTFASKHSGPTTVKVPHQCEGSDRKDYNDWIKWLLNGIRRECRFGKDSGLPSETSGDCKGQCRTVICFAQAITTIKSPTEFTTISSDFSKRQVEMFKSHAKELTDFAMNRQP